MNEFIICGIIYGNLLGVGLLTLLCTVFQKYGRFMIQNGAESTSQSRRNHALLPIQLIHDQDTPAVKAWRRVEMVLGKVGMIKILQLFKHGEEWGWRWEGCG